MVYKHYKTYESRCSWIYLIKNLNVFVEFGQVCICSNVGKWRKMDVVCTVVTSFTASTLL